MGPIIHRQTVELWYEGSENRYGQYLGELRDPAKLRTMAQWICKTQQCRTLSKTFEDYEHCLSLERTHVSAPNLTVMDMYQNSFL